MNMHDSKHETGRPMANRSASLFFAGLASVMTAASVGAVKAAERVTVDNFTRVETDYYFKKRVDAGCFGKLCQERGPSPVERQGIVRLNRDTPLSSGVFDLSTPVTIVKPDTGKRFQSMVVINEDHYIKLVAYGPGSYELTQEKMGSRYVQVVFRTFMDPNDPADVAAGHAAQDEIKVIQSDPGKFEAPDWDQDQRERLREALLRMGPFVPDSRRMFGDKPDVDEVRHLVGTAGGFGGNREQDALYLNVNPKQNDGETPYSLTVKDVPVDGFWSITVYNAKGFYEAPENAISVNNVTAKKSADGAVTVHFGGDPSQPNALRIMPGWNYTVRLYRPKAEILEGKWTFPEAQPTK
jgi:hypothetical protein